MRIYFSQGSDPMITGTVAELNTIASKLDAFLATAATEITVPASTAGSAGPYNSLLPGLRLTRRPGPIMVTVEPSIGLAVAGSADNLAKWCSHFRFAPGANDGDHHHPDHIHKPGYLQAGTLSVIIEVHEEDRSAF